MSKLDDLIEDIHSDERFLTKKNMQSKVYSDEPILKRASQLKNYLPPEIREMREMGREYSHYNWSSPVLFCMQGEFMADYEDDCEYDGMFFLYYPTYQLMNDAQLRGYFTWRTKVRRGEFVRTSTSFVFVYIYELLNMIGVQSPLDGFYKLKSFREQYALVDPAAESYLRDWLIDYAAYYEIEPEVVRELPEVVPFCRASAIMNYAACDRETLLDAVYGLASYNIKNSKFYKTYPEDTEDVVYGTIMALSEFYEKNRKNTLFERCFGKPNLAPYGMFSNAVFRRAPHDDTVLRICPGYEYICNNGRWYRTRLERSPAKNRMLGSILRDIDAIMREKYNFDKPLQQTDKTKIFVSTVEKVIAEVQAKKKKKAASIVDIDLSKLGDIRSDAVLTREKLLTDEERGTADDVPPEAPENSIGETNGVTAAETAAADGLPLDGIEMLVLRSVLYGEDCSAELRRSKRMLSVVIESINDRLFDMFGDTVIFFDGDKPAVFEDYEEELKGMIPQ